MSYNNYSTICINNSIDNINEEIEKINLALINERHQNILFGDCNLEYLEDDDFFKIISPQHEHWFNKLSIDILKYTSITNISDICKILKTINGVITGSFITNVISPFKKGEPGDIDIFIHLDKTAYKSKYLKLDLIHRFLFKYGYRLCKNTLVPSRYTWSGSDSDNKYEALYEYKNINPQYIPVQLILMNKSHFENINSFDFTICQSFWNGEKFIMRDRNLIHHNAYTMKYIGNESGTERYKVRLAKYIDRGFKLVD